MEQGLYKALPEFYTPWSKNTSSNKKNTMSGKKHFVNVSASRFNAKWNAFVKFSLFALATSMICAIGCFYFGVQQLQSGNTVGEVVESISGAKYREYSEVEKGQQKVLYGYAFLAFSAFFFHQAFYSSTFGLFRKQDMDSSDEENTPLLPGSVKTSGILKKSKRSSVSFAGTVASDSSVSSEDSIVSRISSSVTEFFKMNGEDSSCVHSSKISSENWDEKLLAKATLVDDTESFDYGSCAAPAKPNAKDFERQTVNFDQVSRNSVASGAVVDDYTVGFRFVPTSSTEPLP
jgi:hypothetical protein